MLTRARIGASRARRVAILCAGLAAVSEPALAQINVENFAQVGFNFSAPGARSAGLGGAFISLADDATAAETNPAGLTTLLRPEVSFEFKGVEYARTVPEEAGGALGGGTEFNDPVAIPSFASIVVPIGSLTLGAFRHELVNYRSRTFAVGHSFEDNGDPFFLFPYTTNLDIRVENYGAATAIQLGAFSIGAAGGVSLLSMELEYLRYQLPRFEPQLLANQVIVSPEDGKATSFFVNAGVLLRPSERFSIGAVYRLRPKFEEMRLQSLDQFSEPFDSPDTLFSVNVPDAVGAGISARPHDLLTLSVDAVWNFYSQVAEEMAFTFDVDGAGNPIRAEDFVADDGVDIHGGAEWILLVGNTYFALRGGAARLAPSNTYYIGESESTRLLWGDEAGETTMSYSAGLGTALFGRLQLDLAGTMADDRTELIASAVFRFGQ